jgi:ribose transport system substrate-binding protein
MAFFPERYGEGLIQVALQILAKKSVPPAVFVKNQLLTPANVDHLYPTDAVVQTAELTTALMGDTA